jgi:hypothetical protein
MDANEIQLIAAFAQIRVIRGLLLPSYLALLASLAAQMKQLCRSLVEGERFAGTAGRGTIP